jgi:predicted nucleic acid-binding protein
MDIVFLDANILFSAAYQPKSDFLKLWGIPAVRLVTSAYAADEARRNLQKADQRERLEQLLGSVKLVEATVDTQLPKDIIIPAKDQPILLAAIAANATHLLTGDWKHFGPYRNKVIGGVLILSTTSYFRARSL